jgi:replicative DNA helicase
MADANRDRRGRNDAGSETRRPAAGRVPPHNLAAEESLLGALLLSRDALNTAAELGVVAANFYKPAHQHIYEAVRVLTAAGEPVDVITVAEELRRAGLLEEIGGAAALLDLQATTPAISTAGAYAKIVQDTSLLRRLIGVAGEIAELAYSDPDDVTKAVDEAESKMFEIAEHRVVDSTKAIGDLLHGTMNDLEVAYERGSTITGIPTGFVDLDELLSGLQPSTLNVVGARPAMGKCVAWDTEILDPATGDLVTAAELHRRGVAGSWVQVLALGNDGRLRVATATTFVDDGRKPVFEVRTRLGRCIRTTASHPFLTEAGWCRLAELAPGTPVAVAARLPWFGNDALPGGERVLLAEYLGDGGLRTAEARRRDEAVRRCRELDVDAVAVLRRHGCWRADDDALRLPPAVLRLPREQLLRFLGRLLAANRAARGAAGEAFFVARSERLARDVQHALLRFGIVTALHERPTRPGRVRTWAVVVEHGTEVHADADALEVVGVRARTLVGVGGAVPAPARPGRDVLWDPVESITEVGLEQVYDLTVPVLHNFVAADVVVHNTSFALGIASHVAVDAGLPVLFFSLEMGHKELAQRILASEARVDSKKLRTGQLTEQDWSKIGRAVGRLEAPLYIDDNPHVTVMEIRAKARRLAARAGKLGLVVIDYLQLMSGRGSAENRQVEVSEMSRGLKILARELEVPIIALSQLSRNLESRADKRPMLADLRESGCLTADTRVVRCDTNAEVTLGELHERGERNIPVWTLDEHYQLTAGVMTHVFSSGRKEVFELCLASGRRIRASGNHPFLTLHGWQPVDHLDVGVLLATARRIPEPTGLASWAPASQHAGDVEGPRRVGTLERARVSPAVSDVRWDQLVDIRPLGVEEVFDATVPGTHNFLANGVVAHNSIEQDADVVMFIYRDEVYNADSQDRGSAEVIVAKHRNGPIGTRRLAFLNTYTRFDNAARGV